MSRAPEQPVDPGPHDLLLGFLALGLLARGLLGLLDAWSLGTTGVRVVGPDAAISLGGGSVGWSIGWGVAAIVAAVLVFRRRALAWLLAAATCAAYLVTGIGEAVQITRPAEGGAPAALSLGTWAIFLVDLAAPAVLLAMLFAVRPWFLAVSRSR